MSELKKALESKGLSYDNYLRNINLGNMLLTMATHYTGEAADLLRRTGQYRLDTKRKYEGVLRKMDKLLKCVDNLEDEKDLAFFGAVGFLTDLIFAISTRIINLNEQKQILSYITDGVFRKQAAIKEIQVSDKVVVYNKETMAMLDYGVYEGLDDEDAIKYKVGDKKYPASTVSAKYGILKADNYMELLLNNKNFEK